MSARKRFQIFWICSAGLAFWIACSAIYVAAQAQQVQQQSQMRQMATRAAAGPIKLDVQPEVASAVVNSNVSVRVFMRNADNQPATWERPCTLNLEVTFPSKKVERQQMVIPVGQNSGSVTFVATEYGVTHIRVAEATDSLLSAGNTVFIVSPPRKHAKSAEKKPRPSGVSHRDFLVAPGIHPRFMLASWKSSFGEEAIPELQNPPPAPAATSSAEPPTTPQLLLVNSTGKEEILSDGKDFARVSVYYMAPDGKGAPSDILLWMSWSNGTFNPQPMVIHRGEMTAEGKLVSGSPVEATISLVSSAPKMPVQGSSTIHVVFSPPIYGFGPATSESVVKMSLIDREPLVGCFFDDQGRCIQTDHKRHVNVSSTNPSLHVEPDSFDVSANDGTATFYLEPTWSGTASLDMWTPGHNKQRIAIEISLWLVVVLCLVGGVAGGIAARDTLKGSIWWRSFIGIMGAIVLVWLCVFTVVPQTHSMIAHSLISVLVVGIVGGYAGTRVLDFAAKKLGVLS
jgi:hypothetical protein